MSRTFLNSAWMICVLLAGGCSLGPVYEVPEENLPETFDTASEDQSGYEPTADLAWWKQLNDPLLVQYVEEALRSNLELQVARARVREARALMKVAGASDNLQVATDARAQQFGVSENAPGGAGSFIRQGLADRDGELFQGGFDASWEIDIFGQTRKSVEAATARYAAAGDDRRDVMLTVVSEVARLYVEIRGAQRQLDTARKNIRIQEEALEIVNYKYSSGLVSELDVYQARQQLEQSRALLPPLRAAMRANAHTLARLLGKQPSSLLDTLMQTRPIPNPPDIVPVGLPSSLIGRRPDLRAARHELQAATAEVGVSIAQLYPQVSLTGSAGVEAATFSDIFKSSSGLWTIGPSISWPVFQGGRIRGNIESKEALLDQTRDRYRQAVLVALEEVETALISYAEVQNERERLQAAVDAGNQALSHAQELYNEGLREFLTVLDAERTLTQLEDRLAEREKDVVIQLISLYKALGGGWKAGDMIGQNL